MLNEETNDIEEQYRNIIKKLHKSIDNKTGLRLSKEKVQILALSSLNDRQILEEQNDER